MAVILLLLGILTALSILIVRWFKMGNWKRLGAIGLGILAARLAITGNSVGMYVAFLGAAACFALYRRECERKEMERRESLHEMDAPTDRR
jgi:hypothetical protein